LVKDPATARDTAVDAPGGDDPRAHDAAATSLGAQVDHDQPATTGRPRPGGTTGRPQPGGHDLAMSPGNSEPRALVPGRDPAQDREEHRVRSVPMWPQLDARPGAETGHAVRQQRACVDELDRERRPPSGLGDRHLRLR
jgi:hypothetical protein